MMAGKTSFTVVWLHFRAQQAVHPAVFNACCSLSANSDCCCVDKGKQTNKQTS